MPKYRCTCQHIAPARDEEPADLGVFSAPTATAAIDKAHDELTRVINPSMKEKGLPEIRGTVRAERLVDEAEAEQDAIDNELDLGDNATDPVEEQLATEFEAELDALDPARPSQ